MQPGCVFHSISLSLPTISVFRARQWDLASHNLSEEIDVYVWHWKQRELVWSITEEIMKENGPQMQPKQILPMIFQKVCSQRNFKCQMGRKERHKLIWGTHASLWFWFVLLRAGKEHTHNQRADWTTSAAQFVLLWMGKENTHKQSQGELKNPCDSVCTACNLVLLLRMGKERPHNQRVDEKGKHTHTHTHTHNQKVDWAASVAWFILLWTGKKHTQSKGGLNDQCGLVWTAEKTSAVRFVLLQTGKEHTHNQRTGWKTSVAQFVLLWAGKEHTHTHTINGRSEQPVWLGSYCYRQVHTFFTTSKF